MQKNAIVVGAILVALGLSAWAIKANSSHLRSAYNAVVSSGYKQTIVTSNLVVPASGEGEKETVGVKSNTTTDQLPVKAKPKMVVLAVPFVAEAPDGKWTGSWKNACEEASMVMVEKFYAGENVVETVEAKSMMERLFKIEVKLWGSDANSDVLRTAELINDYTSITAKVVEKPTIEQLKNELRNGRPIIAPINGKTLDNVNIPFLRTGSYYHMLVITGYDDAAQEFITNDDGDLKTGQGHHYPYDLIMRAMHDYAESTKTTDGPQRAIFTAPKQK